MRPSEQQPLHAVVLVKRHCAVGVLFLLLLGSARGASQPDSPETPEPGERTAQLEQLWPGYPESLAMFAEILAGNTLSPDSGWYRKGVSQTRFDWKSLASRFDRNHDGRVVRDEFRGPDTDFNAIDRDRDGMLTSADLDFSTNRSVGSFAIESFGTADVDSDGKVTRQELVSFTNATNADPLYRLIYVKPRVMLEARLGALEQDGSGFLTLSDFQEAFELSSRQNSPAVNSLRTAPAKVDQQALLRSFLRQEMGAFGPGPPLNCVAPDFKLATTDGQQEITLSKWSGQKPVVLIFGNITCGPFRSHAGSLERLYERYKDRVNFLVIYTREAHPSDGWQFDDNRRVGIVPNQPRDIRERSALAQTCRKSLRLGMPVLVDTMDDRVGARYSGMPSRLYLVDGFGKIAYKGGRGPFGFKPAELEQSLIFLVHAAAPPPF